VNRLVLLLPLLALLPACRPGAGYVKADRLTFDAVAPSYSAYVASDQALSSEQRERRQRTIDSWRARLEQAEAGDEEGSE
jgi:hypothetical protein